MTTLAPTDPGSTDIAPPDAPPVPATESQSLPDTQRAALRDLVALATECAATEARIEQELQAATASSTETYEKATKTISFRASTALDQAKQKHESALAEISQKYQADTQGVRAFAIPARKRAESELEQTDQLVAKKIQEAVWLADSDLEVTNNTLAAEQKKLNGEVAGHFAWLDKREKEVIDRAVNFGYRPSEDELKSTSPHRAESESGSSVAIPADPDPAGTFAVRREEVVRTLKTLADLGLPRTFVGITPFLILFMLAVLSGGLGWYLGGLAEPNYVAIGIAAGGTLLIAIVLGVVLRKKAMRQVKESFTAAATALSLARQAGYDQLTIAADLREKARERAVKKREAEIRVAKDKYAPGSMNARKRYEQLVAQIDLQAKAMSAQADADRDSALTDAEARNTRRLTDLQQKIDLEQKSAKLHYEKQTADARQRYDTERLALETRLKEGLATIQGSIEATASAGNQAPHDWNSPEWADWKPTKVFASAVRFGKLHVDLRKIAKASSPAGATGELKLALPAPFDLPAPLAFPKHASLLIQADREGRADAIRALQGVMSRLLVSLPPGRVRFVLLDPVGLGENFAGFMHLADHDDQLVGGRIWTEQDQIDVRLNNLTGHMETVIQKYLRNEFETIDDYNAQAGELAEPYRFLVVSDFPAGFQDESLRRLSSIATSGARCGIYTLIFNDTRLTLPHGVTVLEDLMANSVTLGLRSADGLRSTDGLRIADFGMRNDEQRSEISNYKSPYSDSQSEIRNPKSAIADQSEIVWKDPVFQQFPLTLDPPPSEDRLTRICDVVGRGAKEAARVEVPFETIAPPTAKIWSQDSGVDIHAPVGRQGATRLQQFRLGRGVAQHVLIAGKTGSGKSTLLHALVTNMALWYGPDQVEFYLIDFKKGVEFKTYATYNLPHARAIAVESDREFGLSVLQRLDAELSRRGEIYRAAGVQDLASYRKSPGAIEMPRTMLIIDEFQEFFSEDDKLAQDSTVLLDRLVRQGRAFGIHCLLGSQTIAGASGLPRSTIGQMAVRVALMTSEADSQLILGDNNSAARLLSRPGEAIYNDQGGLVEGNSPFQVAWLSDERKDSYLAQIRDLAIARKVKATPPIVFEGNAPADLTKNARLAELLANPGSVTSGAPRAWVGDPVAIKDPTSVPMRRQSGANVLIIGQAEDASIATLAAAMISLAAQLPAGRSGGVVEYSGGGVEEGSEHQDPTEPPHHSTTPPLHQPHSTTQSPLNTPRFYVLDATPSDSPIFGTFAKLRDALPHDIRMVEWRSTGDAINEIAKELGRRRDEQDLAAAPIFLFVVGLQRYRILRKAEDEFSFGIGSSGDDKPADPGKQFAEILKDGPMHGIHILAWADTATAVDRTLDRGSLREFDNRVLFQMGANDSSNLIDSPAANRLGFHRALVFSEEQGVMEKFRPYALPTDAFLAEIKEKLGRR